MKKKFIGCFSIAVAVLVIGCFVYQFHATPKKAKADTVPSLVEEMKNIIDKKQAFVSLSLIFLRQVEYPNDTKPHHHPA